MDSREFSEFRLVGGTSLSLQIGHRMSVDIDLFTDATYGSIDFETIDDFLISQFSYVDTSFGILPGMGRSYLIGADKDHSIKLDIFYTTEDFIKEPVIEEGIRMATVEDIIAMKVDVISRGGRKKDFWDLHELLNDYPIAQMLALHEKRSPYNHVRESIINNFRDFAEADYDFEPLCLRGKHWELIKLDFLEALEKAGL
ncbi:nucleotidyl transferase AbiEii/AbiGii toxin family protein [Pedobacter sp. L105]|uniref:nucleotidyl transferase AbiEii/AbiGii toxin family protein n=1 Tax=Pedobacter sp. L105 TaxID=1641871 RepID=UPI0020B157DE|nr:nucleotidyl transferase AbiEii/AbiGii toxin family protein [Pedobacter sp. L105]